MIWKAIISKPQFSSGRFWCKVEYSNDTTTEVIEEPYSNDDPNVLSTNWPSNVVNARIARLNALAAVDLTKIPIGKPNPDPEPVIVTDDPAVVEQQQRDDANRKLLELKQIADAHAWAATQQDPAVAALLAQAK